MNNIYSKISRSILLLSSVTVLTLTQAVETKAQRAPALRSTYRNTRISQDQCVRRALNLLLDGKTVREIKDYGAIVGGYVGSTTLTIHCIANNQTVVFSGAGVNTTIVDDWVNWMADNF